MREEKRNPAALAGAHRVDATVLDGNSDFDTGTEIARDLQVRRLLNDYALSRPVALVIAEHAFGSGRRA